jgi:EamA-like transporter family.
MQRYISHTNTALIFCTEPVFAAAYAWIAIDERLGWYGLGGALLIMIGMIVSIVPVQTEDAPVKSEEKSIRDLTGELESYRAGE